MMFKSGVILATAAAGLLVGAPAAWAACKDDNHHTKSSHHKSRDDDDDNDRGRHERHARADRDGGVCNGDVNQVNQGRSGGGLINVSNVNVAVPVNLCKTDILSGTLGILAKDLRSIDR